jgi:metal transporter CNNM
MSKPVAMILDKAFGDHGGELLNQKQMRSALEYQTNKDGSLLTSTEKNLLQGSLQMSELVVENVMVPLEDTFCLDINAVVNHDLLQAVLDAGHSQLPVVDYDTGAIQYGHPVMKGLLHVKDLMVVDPENAVPIKTLLALFGRDFLVVCDDQPLLSLVRQFRKSAQLACVKTLVSSDDCDPHWRHCGIVTLQDVVNSIVQEDIQEKEDDGLKKPSHRVFSNASGFDGIVSAQKSGNAPARPVGETEAVAIQAFFAKTQPGLFGSASEDQIRQLILEDCRVMHASKGQPLYQRGVAADFACLVLAGEVQLYSGREAFKSTRGAWGFFGQPALDMYTLGPEKFEYIPDFSAYPEDGARLLICPRSMLLK